MTFIEKSAWIMFFALGVSGAFYSWTVYTVSLELGETAPPNVGLIALSTIIIVAFAILGHAFAALGNPADADAPEDERDKQIAWRSGNISGYVLGIAAMFGLWHYAFLGDGHLLFHTVVIGLVLSQLAEYGLSLWFYRRGFA
ncbi:MAG: hypothetical protein AAFR33_10640 [Pseudomonadota bacterium]